MILSMKAAVHLDPKDIEYPEVSKNSEFDDIESPVQYRQELDNGQLRSTKCEMSRLYEPFMDEIYVA